MKTKKKLTLGAVLLKGLYLLPLIAWSIYCIVICVWDGHGLASVNVFIGSFLGGILLFMPFFALYYELLAYFAGIIKARKSGKLTKLRMVFYTALFLIFVSPNILAVIYGEDWYGIAIIVNIVAYIISCFIRPKKRKK